jgi:hypothetical protein
MKNRILSLAHLGSLAVPAAFAQVSVGGQTGVTGQVAGPATTPVAGAMTDTARTARDAAKETVKDTREAGKDTVRTAKDTAKAAVSEAKDAARTATAPPTATTAVDAGAGAATRAAPVTGATSVAGTVGTTTATGTQGTTVGVDAGVGAQGAANASPQAVEAVSGNPTAAANSAVTAAVATVDALTGTGQALSEEEAKQARMEELAKKKAKRDARKKHK